MMSPEKLKRLHQLCDSGLSMTIVAQRLGVSIAVVSYHRCKLK